MSNALPVQIYQDPTLSSSLLRTNLTSANNGLIGPFTPEVGRTVYMKITASVAATGKITLLRSNNAGATTEVITINGSPWYDLSLLGALGTILNESVDTPESARLTYYVNVNLTAGTISFEVYQ